MDYFSQAPTGSPGITNLTSVTPPPNTPAPHNAPHQGLVDGTGPANASQNMAWIYEAMGSELIAVIKAAGLVPDKDNWAQVAQAVGVIANAAAVAATPLATDTVAGKVRNATAAQVGAGADDGAVSISPADLTAALTATGAPNALQQAVQAQANAASGQQIFTASGTFTVPVGVSKLYVSLVGGGGGGAGAINGAPFRPGGGGAGGVGYKVPIAVTPGQSIAVTIGAGGSAGVGSTAGGTYANSNGGTGGISSFGGLLSANGGGGGRCQPADSLGGVAGSADYSSDGACGDGFASVLELGGAGGGNIFAATNLPSYFAKTGNLYGGGGVGGRAVGHWKSGGAGASGLCIVEW